MAESVGYRGKGVSEFVGLGHPDKKADYIADYLVDALQMEDPDSRAGLEVMVGEGTVFVCGEYYCGNKLPRSFFRRKVLEALANVTHPAHASLHEVTVKVSAQSPEISFKCFGKRFLCPDQGIVWGYATCETHSRLPRAQEVGQKLVQRINDLADSDGRVTNDFKLVVMEDEGLVTAVKCSIKHQPSLTLPGVREIVEKAAIDPVLAGLECEDFCVSVNPGGAFPTGVHSDSGVTNRKIIVDSYGANVEHGGGGFSGKDLTKPDRLLAYYARYIALNVVASRLAPFCKVKLVYLYGDDMIDNIEIHCGVHDIALNDAVKELFSLPYEEIYRKFNDYRGFAMLAAYGHFGICRYFTNPPWENPDKVAELIELHGKFKGF